MKQSPTALAAGLCAIAFLIAVAGGALLALIYMAARPGHSSGPLFDQYLIRVIIFTLWQAGLSTLLSLASAIPVARALARQGNFPGRKYLLWLFGLPLALPALVVALAVLGVFGKAGWFMQAADWFGWQPRFSVFGLTGILLAHVFFNMPVVVRLLLARLDSIPAETWRLAGQLGLPSRVVFKQIEWPVMRQVLGGAGGLVFMLCLSSFTIVLTLGGGPGATTMEVAIYQALRFDFEPARAVMLALVQLAITLTVLTGLRRIRADMPLSFAIRLKSVRFDGNSWRQRTVDGLVIFLAGAFIGFPVLTLLVDGLGANPVRLLGKADVQNAILTSLKISIAASALALPLGFALVRLGQIFGGMLKYAGDISASAILVMPPVVLGAGWFVVLHRFGHVFSFAAPVVIIINALMALPFVYRVIQPAMHRAAHLHDRLCANLAISGISRWRIIDWPVLKRPLAMAAGFSMALSLGDLGAIALFGSQDLVTLPLLLLQKLGSYRTGEAAGLALLLGSVCIAILYATGTSRHDRGKTGA